MRNAWSRLVQKQSLIFYPLALAAINTLAFFAVYAAGREPLRWSKFVSANLDRWQYVGDTFFAGFSFTPALAIAVFAGLAVCAFSGMIRAPYFRAIAGPGHPLAPRDRDEAARLSLFYLFSNLVIWVMPLAIPANSVSNQLVALVVLVVAILIVFADYAIVFEGLGFPAAVRRSAQLLSRRWIVVLLIFVILQLVYFGLNRLYEVSYQDAAGPLVLLPLGQILLESFIILFVDLLLIYLYEQIRRESAA